MTVAAQLGAVGSASVGPAMSSGSKTCLGCGRVKEYKDFHRQSGKPGGRRPRCKECRKPGSRKWYADNAGAIKARTKAWREANPERQREYERRWVGDNYARKRELDRRYHQEHREERLAYNKTPERRAAHRINAKNQRAKRKAAIGATVEPITADQWEALKGSYSGLCVYCLGGCADPTMDHVVPLNQGGDHTAGNIVPACRSCNRSKSDMPLLVFLVRRPIVA